MCASLTNQRNVLSRSAGRSLADVTEILQSQEPAEASATALSIAS